MATIFGILALVGGVLAIGMAAFVLATGAGRPTNRALAALLYFEGLAHVGGVDHGLSAATDAGLGAVHILSVVAAIGCYLVFLGTIRSPLASPLRGRGRAPAVLALTGIALVAVFTQLPVSPADMDAGREPAWARVAYLLFAFVAVYGLAVAVTAVRAAPRGSPERDRALAYAWAFGARDAMYVLGLLVPWHRVLGPDFQLYFIEAAPILFVPLVAYGILRTQLFDVDLRIKTGLRRGTVVATFVVVFVLAAQVAQEFLTDAYGWLVGGAAAAALLLAIAPLQRVAERVADAAMPGVSASPEYMTYRKLHVYRATVEELLADGSATAKERSALERLRRELSIAEDDARAIEREVVIARAPTAAPPT